MVRPLVTAQPVADCAPGVAVLVSKAVSDVLQPLKDAIGGAALVVAPVTVATQFQQLTRQAAAKPLFVYVLVGDVDGEIVLRVMRNHDFKRAVSLHDADVGRYGGVAAAMAAAAKEAERVRAAARGKGHKNAHIRYGDWRGTVSKYQVTGL